MAFPQVRSSQYSTSTSSTTHDVTLPTNIVAGELLLAVSYNATGLLAPTGWTRLRGITAPNGEIFSRTADGNEGATETFTVAGGGSRPVTFIVYAISGWAAWDATWQATHDTLTPPDITTAYTGTDNLFIIVGGLRDAARSFLSADANFGNLLTPTPVTEHYVASARRELASASLSGISAFTLDAATTAERTAWTIAVQGTTSPRLGFTLSGIKEPNAADTLVTGVSTARVVVWLSGDDTAAASEEILNQSITAGAMEVELSAGDVTDSPKVFVEWTGSGETKFFLATPTIVDLDA